MSNFLYYTNRLRQFVPLLSPEQAEEYVNQAWRDIRQSNDEWTFLYGTEYWLAPAQITLSGVAVTQFSDTVELAHDNLSQLADQNNPALTTRQFRVGPTGGPIYNIIDCNAQSGSDGAITATDTTLVLASGPFDSGVAGQLIVVVGAGAGGTDLETTIASYTDPTTVELTDPAVTTVSGATVYWGSTLTLERPYYEESNSDATASVYRMLYQPLTTDFDRLDYVADPILGYEFAIDIRDRSELDMIDPRRGSQGQPYRLYFHSFDDETQLPVYEMWPAPTAQRAYLVARWTQGLDFVDDTDSLPPRIPEELLLMRARLLAYEWAMTAEPDPRKAAVYATALNYVRSRYSTEGQPGRPLGLLDQVLRRDRSIALTKLKRFPKRYGPGWPIGDSNFAQNHAIPAWSFNG